MSFLDLFRPNSETGFTCPHFVHNFVSIVREKGFEPSTSSLEDWHSNQLSYSRIIYLLEDWSTNRCATPADCFNWVTKILHFLYIYKCNLLKILNYSHELFRKEFSKNELLSGQDSNLSVLSQLVLETSAVDHLATTQ